MLLSDVDCASIAPPRTALLSEPFALTEERPPVSVTDVLDTACVAPFTSKPSSWRSARVAVTVTGILRADDKGVRRTFERLQAHVLRRGEHHAVGRTVRDGAALVVAAGVGIHDRVGD